MGYLTKISILAVLADRDWSTEEPSRISTVFQSSRSLRTATVHGVRQPHVLHGISILAVLADRDSVGLATW